MTTASRYRLGLGLVLVAAFALRLIYGWAWPDGGRFWDEQYTFMNVRSLYEERTFEPARSYYPSPVVNLPPTLLVALSEKLESWTGDGSWNAIEDHRFAAAAYRWARGLQAFYGALAVLFVYLAGARLFGRAEGFLASLALAFAVWPIHSGGSFKPDAQLTAFVAAALFASALQMERPDWRRAVLAGTTIALAASAKLTGVLVAAPLAVVALALGFRQRRHWWSLAVAGITSFVVFVALNPYWTAYPAYIHALRRDYAPRAETSGMTRAQVPGRVVDFVTSPEVLGWLLGGVALVGLAILLVRTLSPGTDSRDRSRAALIVVFPIVLVASYAAQTAYFKPNQFLPTLPFLSLAGSWLVVSAWRRLSRRIGRSEGDRLGAVLLVVLTLLAAGHGARYVYQALVPTTLDLAKTELSRHPPFHQRHYLVEEGAILPGFPWERSGDPFLNRILVEIVPSLSQVGEERLALADGWVFPAGGNGFHAELESRVENRPPHYFSSRRVEARRMKARGPDLAVLAAWPRILAQTAVSPSPCGEGCFEGMLPRRESPLEAVSFSIYLPLTPIQAPRAEVTLEVDGEPVRLLQSRAWSLGRSFRSERLPGRKRALPWRLQLNLTPREPPIVEIWRWRLWPSDEAPEATSAEPDVVGVGQSLEPGEVDPGQDREGDDHQDDHQ